MFYRLGRYSGSGKLSTLQETELDWILAGRIQHPGQLYGEAGTSCLIMQENSLVAQLQRF